MSETYLNYPAAEIYSHVIENQKLDKERALYAARNTLVKNCRFEGEQDGESALKECRNIMVKDCFFDLRYPFWHDENLIMDHCILTENCRAALWYARNTEIYNCRLDSIKAVRECNRIILEDCQINSPEFGWSARSIKMKNCKAVSEYFLLRAEKIHLDQVSFKGKYSFQYTHNVLIENCDLDTKDCLWHAENVLVRNCLVKGEYLAWYSKHLTFENCTIIGTQPFCYCEDLKLINCTMENTDLSFERSQVQATLNSPIDSIKNPLEGLIIVPYAKEIIFDLDEANGRIIETNPASKNQ